MQSKHNKDAVAVEMLPGVVRRTLTETASMMLCEFSLADGAEVPLHAHPHDQIGYVARGKIEMQIGDEVVVFAAGDSYAIPGGVPHSGRAVDDDCVVVDIFHPVREEYR